MSSDNLDSSYFIQETEQRILRIASRNITWYLRKGINRNAPTIFIFHGHGYGAIPAKFQNPNYNIVCPMDDFGYEHMGCWYLGEEQDFFWLCAIQKIYDIVNKENGISRLYFWGSSMGGYAALLYGYLYDAYAIYANVPQTNIYGSTYYNMNRKFFDRIFKKDNTYNQTLLVPPSIGGGEAQYTLVKFIQQRKSTLYVLSFAALEGCNYFQEQALPLINHFTTLRQRYYCEIFPSGQHQRFHTIASSLEIIKNLKNME